MSTRMDRYDDSKKANKSRLSKNKDLYVNLSNNLSYIEFTDVNSSNIIDLTSKERTNTGRRENYHRTKDVNNAFGNKCDFKVTNDDYSYDNEIETVKSYDINLILENAKKNRGEVDELERKRKLHTLEYDILTELAQEKLKNQRESKKEVLTEEEKVELEELVHTITSKKIRNEIDEELLSGLMPSKLDETLVSEDLSSKLLEESNSKEKNNNEVKKEDDIATMSKIDSSFYTKSMDLSDEDLFPNQDDEDDDNIFEEERNIKNLIVKITIALSVTILVVIVIFILYNSIIGGK